MEFSAPLRETLKDAMKIFIYEYTCATEADSRLRCEGSAMLSAIAEDFASAGCEVTTLLHPNVSLNSPGVRYERTADEQRGLKRNASNADWTLVIAPETNSILTRRCQWAEDAGAHLLGPPASWIARHCDKWQCHRSLQAHALPSPMMFPARENGEVPSFVFPGILKPRFGAGSQATYIVSDRAELATCLQQAQRHMPNTDFVVQRFVFGRAASVLGVNGNDHCTPLLPCEQHVRGERELRYVGGATPLTAQLSKRAASLANRVLSALSGKRGFIGIDMVLGNAGDGSRDFVIEVNPRLTTSYVALRQMTDQNLAEFALRCAIGERVVDVAWHAKALQLRVDHEQGVFVCPGR